MRLIAWLLTLAFGLSGIAFREQGGIPHAFVVGTGFLFLAALSCPLIWAPDTGLLGRIGKTRKFRIMTALALIVATPLLLPWPFWTGA